MSAYNGVPDGNAPPRPPSRTFPHTAWSAYRLGYCRPSDATVSLTKPLHRDRLTRDMNGEPICRRGHGEEDSGT